MTRERSPLYNGTPEVKALKEIVYRQLDRERKPSEPEPEMEVELEPEVPGRNIDFISFHGR
jgi:hypothetical protein